MKKMAFVVLLVGVLLFAVFLYALFTHTEVMVDPKIEGIVAAVLMIAGAVMIIRECR